MITIALIALFKLKVRAEFALKVHVYLGVPQQSNRHHLCRAQIKTSEIRQDSVKITFYKFDCRVKK